MTIALRLSGGVSNADPLLSLGGAMSATAVPAGEAVSFNGAGIAGITLLSGHGNQPDATGSSASATLSLSTHPVSGARELVFTPYGVQPGTLAADFGNYANVTAGGTHVLTYGSKAISVAVSAPSLPAGTATAKLNATRLTGGLFDDTTAEEAASGAVEYRCFYALNTGPSAKAVQVGFSRKAASAIASLGADPAGVGGTAGAAPDGVAFGDLATATLAAGQALPVWVRREVRAALPVAYAADYLLLTVRTEAP